MKTIKLEIQGKALYIGQDREEAQEIITEVYGLLDIDDNESIIADNGTEVVFDETNKVASVSAYSDEDIKLVLSNGEELQTQSLMEELKNKGYAVQEFDNNTIEYLESEKVELVEGIEDEFEVFVEKYDDGFSMITLQKTGEFKQYNELC